ncbi:MAG: PAS domain S-box protein [Burkholderiaceae bacterium]|nr:PAS domain S-box protein [Burkholderiaceae bacterium]
MRAERRAGVEEEARKQLQQLQLSQIELELQSAALAELQQISLEFESGLQRYAELYERAPVSYFSLTRDGAIARANLAACALLNRSKQQLLGKRFEQFVAAEAQGRLRQFIDAVFGSGARQVLEVVLFQDFGWVRIEANVDAESCEAGVCRMIVTELSDPLLGESALRRAFTILDNINEGVLVTDSRNKIVSVNPSFTKITGYRAEEAIGRDPSFLRGGGATGAHHADMWRGLNQDGSWQGEVANRRKSGEPFIEWLSITELRAPNGEVANFVGVFTDITERKRAEDALRELHAELDQRVVERTAELTRANSLLRLEIGERERAEVALRDAEHFFHATIDSLAERVLVLDQDGAVVHANKACCEFAGHAGAGIFYLEYCENDRRWQRGAGRELADGIRAVIEGARHRFALEYEFDKGAAAHWFQATVSRFLGEGPLRVVVAHTDITERKGMERALRQSHGQLRQLTTHLETVKEDERARISRDIHDELGQNLLALRIDISMLAARTANSHPHLHRRVNTVLGNVDLTIKSVRDIMNQLRPMVLDLGLQAALDWQIADFEKRSGGVACRLRVRDESVFGLIGDELAIAVFRIVQEGLSNVTRHAEARRVEIVLGIADGRLRLSIEDDGVGVLPQRRRKSRCFGLLGMAERVGALGGTFELAKYAKGEGCRLCMTIPIDGAGAARG